MSRAASPQEAPATLLLDRAQIGGLVSFAEYLASVERAFRAHGEGRSLDQGLMHLDADGGEFHVKGGGLQLGRVYFGFKINGGFHRNWQVYGLPNIVGVIVLCDGSTGLPLAIMDSGEITRQRTAAAAAVAASHLARRDSRVITISGCGAQGHAQLAGMKAVFSLERAFAYDVDRNQRERFAQEMSARLEMPVEPVEDFAVALRQSDICITCAPSHHYYVRAADVPRGIFIAAMGADSPEKQEIDPQLLARYKLVVDILDQCEQVGELHHAIAGGLMTRGDVHAQLGEVLAGKKPGRTSADEIIIFDSTGTALQDVAAAALVYEKALAAEVGTAFRFLG
ncbi:MAG TPA: ornithine cyclodeaminase family protein [Terriglobales bacterium]|nr:ornithine cyclodeaminase family protein [Terriglobales bacterium]